MPIENVRQSLEECAGFYEKIGDAYTGPVSENIADGNAHLQAAAAALKLAMEEIGHACDSYNTAEVAASHAGVAARRADGIMRTGVTGRSENIFMRYLLPQRSAEMVDHSQAVTSSLVQAQKTLRGGGSAQAKLNKILETVEGTLETSQKNNQVVLENGRDAGVWIRGIRSYLEGM